MSNDPTLVGVAGDWHGNTMWARYQIRHMLERIPHEGKPAVILHLGDFGIWPGDQYQGDDNYLSALDAELREADAELWFIDGNHEDHPRINSWHDKDGAAPPRPVLAVSALGWPRTRIWHLPRGWRWTWHGRTWLAIGGAVSVDRKWRTEGKSWWPQEELAEAQAGQIIRDGKADVIISHDRPAAAPILLNPSSWPPEDTERADAHRRSLDAIAAGVQPSWWMHGHYHQGLALWRDYPQLPYRIAALDCDGSQGNWGILNAETMEWEG